MNVNNPGSAGGTAPVIVASVQPGESRTIKASGTIGYGADSDPVGPAGNGVTTPSVTTVLAPPLPHIALVGRVAGGPWQLIGPGPTTLTATTAGGVELAINDDNFEDNTGALQVQVSLGLPAPVHTAWAASGTGSVTLQNDGTAGGAPAPTPEPGAVGQMTQAGEAVWPATDRPAGWAALAAPSAAATSAAPGAFPRPAQ